MKRFPKDCTKECKHFSCFDLSIDDLVACCNLLNLQCDLCDEDYSFIRCPLEENTKNGT